MQRQEMGIMGDLLNLAQHMDDSGDTSLIFLLPPDQPAWASRLYISLADAGYQMAAADNIDQLIERLNEQSFDAILAADDGACFQTLVTLEDDESADDAEASDDDTDDNESESGDVPIRVLISESPAWELDDQIDADLICEPKSEAVDYRLRIALRQRAKSAALRSENARLNEVIEQQIEELQEQLQELKKHRSSADEITLLKAAILHNVSHELRTPLIAIKGAIQFFAEEHPDAKYLDLAIQSTARLEWIATSINQLASTGEVKMSPVIARDFVDQAIRRLGRSWRYKEAVERVDAVIGPEIPPVLGDAASLVLTFQHLIENALKFSDDDQAVEVRAQLIDNQVFFSVRDYGIGIAPEQIGKIFDAFYQVDSSSTRRHPGAGIGLALVRLCLERHNADITVESEPGRGSTYSFSLQIANLRPDKHT